MAYLLVEPEVLRQKGVEHYNTVPDGRGIIFDGDAKTMGDLGMVQVFWTAQSLKDFIAAEEEKAKAEKVQSKEEEAAPEEVPQSEDAAQTVEPDVVPEEQPQVDAESPKEESKESINDKNVETV